MPSETNSSLFFLLIQEAERSVHCFGYTSLRGLELMAEISIFTGVTNIRSVVELAAMKRLEILAFLIESASQNCVRQVFDYLSDKLGSEIFERLFPVILTDNGGEFADPEVLEHTQYGSQRTRIFYCDPMASWQKPHIERIHEYIRQVIPKGTSMDNFTQDDITLMINHINSFSRDILNGDRPFDAAKNFSDVNFQNFSN